MTITDGALVPTTEAELIAAIDYCKHDAKIDLRQLDPAIVKKHVKIPGGGDCVKIPRIAAIIAPIGLESL